MLYGDCHRNSTNIAFQASQKAQEFGGDLSNFASGVIAAGLIGKSPHVVAAGETIGAFGLAIQSVGALGEYILSGDTSQAALDAAGVVSSFLKTQTKAAQLVTGHTMGAAVIGAQNLMPNHCK